ADPWRRGRPGACRRGSPRRVGGGDARSRLAGHGGVVEGLGSRHTSRVAYLHYTRGGAAAAPTPAAGQGSAGVAPAKQIPLRQPTAFANPGLCYPRRISPRIEKEKNIGYLSTNRPAAQVSFYGASHGQPAGCHR